tara:strand:+ start:3486 stop:4862 length:1377 start_codon:yes stop_codon:yes gene_type:complete
MKTLFPAQAVNKNKILLSLEKFGVALDSSTTGTGKTLTAAYTAKHYEHVAVVCPKIVIPHWERELGECGVEPLFIENYEKIRVGRNKFLSKKGKKTFKWLLPDPGNTLIIWDECHKAKGPFTQNAQMLVAAKNQGAKNLLISATACEDPTEMRALGYALGLHNLNSSSDNLMSWPKWMAVHGCWRNQWGQWQRGAVKHLSKINKAIYGEGKGTKITLEDLPGAFSSNHVSVEKLSFTKMKDIKSTYEDLGVSDEALLERLIGVEHEVVHDESLDVNILTQILRARQFVEALKVPDLIDMVNDALKEDFSVIVFVNFRDTAEALYNALPDPGIIIGGQTAAQREEHVNRFQDNKNRVIIVMTSAGGVGVSLHDTDGRFPRQAILSPTFNLKEHIQALGRAHRAGSKSPVVQKVVVANETIEEKIVDMLEQKRCSLDTLHQKPDSQTKKDETKCQNQLTN